MGIFSSILGAVAAPLIGSIFGRKKSAPQPTNRTVTSEVDYVKMRNSALAAGFNPLTALRNGGSAGFTQTHTPVLSTGAAYTARDGLVAGLQAGVQAAFDYNPLDEQKSQLEAEIMRGQLTRINQTNDHYSRLGDVPVATGSRYVTQGQGTPESRAALAVQSHPIHGETSVTNPLPWGLEVNPTFVDAEVWEKRYGDIAQEIGGLLVNVPGDALHNWGPPWDIGVLPRGSRVGGLLHDINGWALKAQKPAFNTGGGF